MSKMIAPNLRFKEFCEPWQINNLGDLAEVTTGNKDTQNKVDDGLYPFFVRSQTVEKINTYSFDGEAILTSGDGVGVGKNFHYAHGKFDFHQRVYCIRNFKNQISGKFIFHYFAEKFNQRVMRLSAKNSVDSVRRDMITKMPIYHPSTLEQTKIANFLTAVDEKISQIKQKFDLLAQYKKGVMQQIFSQEIRFKDEDGREFPEWKILKLSNLAKIYDGTHMTPDYIGSGVPFYSVEHVTRNNFNETKFIAEDIFEIENKRVKLEMDDILMTRIGDIGTSKFIDWDVKASFYVSLALIKKSKNINPLYLSHFIASPFFQKELHQRTIHVAFPKKINLGEIGECLVNFPISDEQSKIANFLTAIDDKINNAQARLAATKQFKQGLLQQMFV